jgi:trehalose 6-phosphate phosphatase
LTDDVLPEPTTPAGRAGLDAILDDPGRSVIAFDYDGTLSPIVEDPSQATPEPDVVEGLAALSQAVEMVAVVTGRPARVAVDLAGFDHASGIERLVVAGHYGMERWDACSGELQTVEPAPGVDQVRQRLPDLLRSLDLADADIEDKGLSLVVHVRRVADPDDAFARIERPLADLAESAGLIVEPGRLVIELRPPGMDKGIALRSLVEETQAKAVMFVGDDLGDLAAFAEVRRLRKRGVAGLLVCSGSDEVTALADEADILVDGPRGVSMLVSDLLDALADGRA